MGLAGRNLARSAAALTEAKIGQCYRATRRLRRYCPMYSTLYKTAGFCLLLAAPASAVARCEGAVVLGALHDAYLATLTEEGATRLSAAQTLLVLAGSGDSASLARLVARAGDDVDADRLSIAVTDAKMLATETLKATATATPAFRHSSNVAYLGAIYAETGCRNSASTASLTPVTNVSGIASRTEGSQSSKTVVPSFFVIAVAIIAGLGTAAAMAYRFTRSVFYRKRQVVRMYCIPKATYCRSIFLDQYR